MSRYPLLDISKWELIQEDVLASVPDFFIQYNLLMRILKPNGEEVTAKHFSVIAACPHESLYVLLANGDIVATGQASLMLPGGIPTAYISNVVVAEKYRGIGLGKLIVKNIMWWVACRYLDDYFPITFMLTSQEKRGTADFYQKLGFVPTPTIRYVKTSQD